MRTASRRSILVTTDSLAPGRPPMRGGCRGSEHRRGEPWRDPCPRTGHATETSGTGGWRHRIHWTSLGEDVRRSRPQRSRAALRNPRAAALELDGQAVELFAGSHGDPKSASEALDGISAVYHLAKCDGKQWQDYVDGDIAPTRVLAQAALSAGVKRFIYTGTIASYASGNAHDVIDNDTPVGPGNCQRDHSRRSKAACEGLLQAMQREGGLPLVILRPGIVIGPGSPPAHPGVGRFLSETRVDYRETIGTRCRWSSWTTWPRHWCSRWMPRESWVRHYSSRGRR